MGLTRSYKILISKGKTDSTYREELIESLLAKQLANVYELADRRVPGSADEDGS